MITCSTEWASCESKLHHNTLKLPLGGEIRKMISNIQVDITKLSRLEVESRRRKNASVPAELIDKINQDILMIEEYILMATLIG